MKGYINKSGHLIIVRGYSDLIQLCPFQEDAWCASWCPLFGEPKYATGLTGQTGVIPKENVLVSLDICQGRKLVFEEFRDDRTKSANENT